MRKRTLGVAVTAAVAALAVPMTSSASDGHCGALIKQIDRGVDTQRRLTTFVDDNCTPPSPGVPTPTLTPSAESFGAHLLGQSGSETVTFANGTASPVSVAAVVVAGADPSAFSITADACGGAIVPPGGSCAIGVAFTPAAGRSYDAVLAVADDAAGTVRLAHLSGDGPVAPVAFAVTPAPNAAAWPHFLPPTMFANETVWPVTSYTFTANYSPVTVSATDGNGLQLDLTGEPVHLTSDCPMSVQGGADYTFDTAAGHTFAVSLGDVPSFSANCTIRALDPAGTIADGVANADVAGELCDDIDNNGNGAGDELYPQVAVSYVDPLGGHNDNPHTAQTVTIPGAGPGGTPFTTAWTCSADGHSVVPWLW